MGQIRHAKQITLANRERKSQLMLAVVAWSKFAGIHGCCVVRNRPELVNREARAEPLHTRR